MSVLLVLLMLLQAAWWVRVGMERFQIRQPRVMSAPMLLVVMLMQAAWWVGMKMKRFQIRQL